MSLSQERAQFIPNLNQATASEIEAFQTQISSLIYPSIITCSDIAFATSLLASFTTNPSSTHQDKAD
jgi:hypothetical protein